MLQEYLFLDYYRNYYPDAQLSSQVFVRERLNLATGFHQIIQINSSASFTVFKSKGKTSWLTSHLGRPQKATLNEYLCATSVEIRRSGFETFHNQAPNAIALEVLERYVDVPVFFHCTYCHKPKELTADNQMGRSWGVGADANTYCCQSHFEMSLLKRDSA